METKLQNDTFTLIDEFGEEKEYQTLFTFYNEDNKKNYVVYTDDILDEDGNKSIYASIYNPFDEEFNLLPVETDEEWNNIESLLSTVINDIRE